MNPINQFIIRDKCGRNMARPNYPKVLIDKEGGTERPIRSVAEGKDSAQMSWGTPKNDWTYNKKDDTWYANMGIFVIKKKK